MDEFPDEYEEYELLHEEELEVLKEMENDSREARSSSSRQNLNFYTEQNLLDADAEEILANGKSVAGSPIRVRKRRRFSVESICYSNDEGDDDDHNIDNVNVEPPTKKIRNKEFNFGCHCGVTSLKLPKWPFITFNTYDGERFYVRFREDESQEELKLNKISSTSLLSSPLQELKALAEKTLQVCQQRTTSFDSFNCEVLESEENFDLWVDKYKPKRYLELLSDEGVNRSLLNWLKKWDKVVFNKFTIKESKTNNNNNKKIKTHQSNSNASKYEVHDGFDPDGRPEHKIALLCGPPGLGKTTLANVIAALAGYNVIEVNASDDRSIETFHSKLEAATQVQCAINSNKPNCLILDEIDGAPVSSVEYLIKYVNGKLNRKGKKEKEKIIVKRPIICICNEPYLPSLRQLRQHAFVVHFPHTSTTRLAQRLLEICRKQNVKSDLSTLTLLCDKMQSDIRSCISALYFFKSRNGQTFKATDIAKCNIGQKDLQKGLFSLWQEVFQIPLKKETAFTDFSKTSSNAVAHFHFSQKNMERLRYLVQLFSSSGDFERLQQGVYENFLKMKFPNAIQSTSTALDWFCWSDVLDTYIKENQNYILMPYLPYAFAAWHFLLSSTGFTKITFPKDGYENHLKEIRMNQIANDLLRGLNPGIRSHSCRLELILDTLPMFKTILVPSLRPVNLKLFSEREKNDFDHLIDIMIDYNLNYVQQRAADGTYYYQFDPNIEEITQFGTVEKHRYSFSYNMKQLISRELEMERVRRNERSDLSDGRKEKQPEKPEKSAEPLVQKVPNHLQKLTPKEIRIDGNDEAQYRDFFGRIVPAKASVPSKASDPGENLRKSRVWFTYKQGFNNAVKKDITISYLL